ncbi:hypothetical protein BV898_19700 [Hypsibius exemplaris]|uniref:Uncharacterized protein n=1 Tax=Hypsibius exemplaris TaxID=2072580 RepID=A0A9X6NJK0_HYPEX|nr:hypothetical protein BV898_19700 [Hypsibius exemplaris]
MLVWSVSSQPCQKFPSLDTFVQLLFHKPHGSVDPWVYWQDPSKAYQESRDASSSSTTSNTPTKPASAESGVPSSPRPGQAMKKARSHRADGHAQPAVAVLFRPGSAIDGRDDHIVPALCQPPGAPSRGQGAFNAHPELSNLAVNAWSGHNLPGGEMTADFGGRKTTFWRPLCLSDSDAGPRGRTFEGICSGYGLSLWSMMQWRMIVY